MELLKLVVFGISLTRSAFKRHRADRGKLKLHNWRSSFLLRIYYYLKLTTLLCLAETEEAFEEEARLEAEALAVQEEVRSLSDLCD